DTSRSPPLDAHVLDPSAYAVFFCQSSPAHRLLHSFPTRRSSDLTLAIGYNWRFQPALQEIKRMLADDGRLGKLLHIEGNFCGPRDRKSTRLNSSHVSISYAVFCLKKKTPAERRPI